MTQTATHDSRHADDETGGPASGVDITIELESHRRELTAYCYRMLGGTFEAEDAVQETLLRAWRSQDRFEGRSSLRSWLYRIATNVCLDMLSASQRRARPMDLRPAQSADTPLPDPLDAREWIEPIPDSMVVGEEGDPAQVAIARESVKLAFMAALQHLPPKQRAVLILRDVLRWRATEVAALLDTSVASVNSALQRARETLDARQVVLDETKTDGADADTSALLSRYVDAFERYDMDALTAVLHEDAKWNMPPYDLWLNSHRDIVGWCLGTGSACRGSRLLPIAVNGSPGFAQYKPGPEGDLVPWSVQVLEIEDGAIKGITFFLDTQRFFPLWGLPERLA
jgi:RNA polymerase sigma-70 factor, ECF subfamily